MVDYQKTTVSKLKEDLVQGGMQLEDVSKLKGKPSVVEAHKKMYEEEEGLDAIDIESDFETVVDTIDLEQTDDDTPKTPSYTSPEWSDYVMSFFQSNELIDGNPICAGLRRVAEQLLGTIVESGPEKIFPATDSGKPGRATVLYKVVIDWMDTGELRIFKEVADVWHGNTDDLFCAHPAATASTRAEGRALRKALKIRALAAEELAKKDIVEIVQQTVSNVDWNPDDLISNQQSGFIDTKCRQLNIDVMRFINSGNKNYATIDEITKSTAQKMIKQLNVYQTNNESIPNAMVGYTNNWRN